MEKCSYLELNDSVLVYVNVSGGNGVFAQFTGHKHHGRVILPADTVREINTLQNATAFTSWPEVALCVQGFDIDILTVLLSGMGRRSQCCLQDKTASFPPEVHPQNCLISLADYWQCYHLWWGHQSPTLLPFYLWNSEDNVTGVCRMHTFISHVCMYRDIIKKHNWCAVWGRNSAFSLSLTVMVLDHLRVRDAAKLTRNRCKRSVFCNNCTVLQCKLALKKKG